MITTATSAPNGVVDGKEGIIINAELRTHRQAHFGNGHLIEILELIAIGFSRVTTYVGVLGHSLCFDEKKGKRFSDAHNCFAW